MGGGYRGGLIEVGVGHMRVGSGRVGVRLGGQVGVGIRGLGVGIR